MIIFSFYYGIERRAHQAKRSDTLLPVVFGKTSIGEKRTKYNYDLFDIFFDPALG